MASRESPRYDGVAITFHWLIAVIIAATFGLGVLMADLPFSPRKLQLYSWHKWAGVTIFILAVCRLLWRSTHRAPAPIAGMPLWQTHAARWAHRLLYGLMIAVPLSGWLMSSAKGVTTVYFGMWPLPDLLSRNPELGERLLTLHVSVNYTMAVVVLTHIVAALKHQWVDRDGTLSRMLP